MNGVEIRKIENGYTVYSNYKTHFIKTRDELIEFVKEAVENL